MKEIEVKARLKNLDKLLERLEALGCVLSEPVRQIDTVYTKIVGTLDEYLTNDHFVRIREKSDGKFIFTVKKPLPTEVLTRAEYETEIMNKKELEKALSLMGYKMASKVVKIRRTAHVRGFEICIDDVENLGPFIEIEKMSAENVDLIRKELNEFMDSLGISPNDKVHKGYDMLEIESRR